MTVFACQSSDQSIEKVRGRKTLKENPFLIKINFSLISLERSCLYLLEIALHFNKNSWIYFQWQMLTYVFSICCIFWEKNSIFGKKRVKKAILPKNWMFFQYFVFPSPCLYYDLSFDMQKPSHITYIHWKFHAFFPSGLEAIKVLHFTVRSKDGVQSSTNESALLLGLQWPKRYSLQ